MSLLRRCAIGAYMKVDIIARRPDNGGKLRGLGSAEGRTFGVETIVKDILGPVYTIEGVAVPEGADEVGIIGAVEAEEAAGEGHSGAGQVGVAQSFAQAIYDAVGKGSNEERGFRRLPVAFGQHKVLQLYGRAAKDTE